jgi:hypothetical protein
VSDTKGCAVKEEYGLCKLLVTPDHKILGCHIVGYQASVLLHAVLPNYLEQTEDCRQLVRGQQFCYALFFDYVLN